MTGDAPSLCVVNLDSSLGPDLTTLHIEEIDVVREDMDAGEDKQ